MMNWKPVLQFCSAHKGSGCVNRDVASREAKTIPLLCLGHLNKDVVSTFGDYMSIKVWDCRGEPWESADALKEHRSKDENTVCTTEEEMTAMMIDNRKRKPRKGTLVHHASACPQCQTWTFQTIISVLWGHIRNFSDKWTFTGPAKKWINVTLANVFTPILCDFLLTIVLQNTRHAALGCIYLFIKLIDDAFCPLQMQVFAFCRPIDVSQLDAHLTNQQAVVLVGPVNSNIIVHLRDRKKKTMVVIPGKRTPGILYNISSYLTKSLG